MPGPAGHKLECSLSLYISRKAFAVVEIAVSSKSENQITEFGRCITFNIFEAPSFIFQMHIETILELFIFPLWFPFLNFFFSPVLLGSN